MKFKSSDGSELRQEHQDLSKPITLGITVVYRSSQETFRHLPLLQGGTFSSPSRKLYLPGEVYSSQQSCPSASKVRAFALHAHLEQSSPCLATAWQQQVRKGL